MRLFHVVLLCFWLISTSCSDKVEETQELVKLDAETVVVSTSSAEENVSDTSKDTIPLVVVENKAQVALKMAEIGSESTSVDKSMKIDAVDENKATAVVKEPQRVSESGSLAEAASPLPEKAGPVNNSTVVGPQQKMPSIVGTLKGEVRFNSDVSVQGGIVSFFKVGAGPRPDQGKARRVPSAVAKVGKDGKFSTKLPIGTYNMGAMPWKKGRLPGPPRPGEDFMFIYGDDKELLTAEVKSGEITDIGLIGGFKPSEDKAEQGDLMIIRGKVTDENSKPFLRSVVMLKTEINSERPQFVSNPTKEDGKYEFVVPAGVYYLIAREGVSMFGRPKPGSYMGTLGQKASFGAGDRGRVSSLPVRGEAGEVLEDIDIKMFKIPDPEELKKETQERVNAQKIEKPAETPLQQ